MDFAYTKEDLALKHEVREFIVKEVDAAILVDIAGHSIEDGARPQTHRVAALYKKIVDRGWVGIAWPKEYGGGGGSRMAQYIVEEEFARIGLAVGSSGSGAPAILAAGTEEQKHYFIPRIIRGEISFALGFTEPSGGADLASLQARAEANGDFYIVNGQKMYTSSAHVSTHIYLMVRTDPNVPKHKGISILLVPMELPGITVRPLWTIQTDPDAPPTTTYGMLRTNETFFEDVAVPKSALLGKENDGWYVGAAALNLDRVGASRYLISVRRNEDILNWIKQNKLGDYAPVEHEEIRDRLAELWTEAQVARLMTMRSMSIVNRDQEFAYEGAAEKVWAPEHGVKVSETIAQILGPYAQLMNTSPRAVRRGVFAHNLLGAFQSGINHGSVQVMRDQVARRGLGMPRG